MTKFAKMANRKLAIDDKLKTEHEPIVIGLNRYLKFE